MSSALSSLLADLRCEMSARGPRLLVWRGTASLVGVLLGLCISAGDYVALAWAALLWLGVGVVAHALSSGERRRDIVALALFGGSLHMAVGIGIHTVASTFSGGFVTGDDASYYRLASAFARYLQGAPLQPGYSPPLWGGDAYLLGVFVYVETALFLVFGPDVRIPILLNAALAIVTALLVFDATKRLFGSTAGLVAAAIVALFPSLILWSSLNLKDSLTTTLAVSAVWAAVRFQFRPRPAFFAMQFAAAEILITLRSYVAATLAIMALLSIALAGLSPRRRVGAITFAGMLTVIIVAQSLSAVGSGVGEQLLLSFERERAAMAVGARTGFVPTPTPVSKAAPAAAAPGTTSPVNARPGEIDSTPGRTLSYLPIGLAYVILAPFPLSARRLQEVVAAPEMLAWYLLVGAGVATIWRERRRWSYLAPLILAIGGLVLILALAEGNVGTLFRHRAMVIPFAASLASPSLVTLWARRRRKSRTMERQADPRL